MMELEKRICAEFFKIEVRNEPVRDFLKSLEIADKRICRVLFTVEGKRMILLHAFIKKSQKTPLEARLQHEKKVLFKNLNLR